MKKLETFLSGLIIGSIICMIIFAFTSCSTRGGYGCKGNQSWNKMVWRNNRP